MSGNFILQETGAPQYSRKQIVEIVRDSARKHAKALELRRLANSFFEFLAFGDIARRRERPDYVVAIVAQGNHPRFKCPARAFQSRYGKLERPAVSALKDTLVDRTKRVAVWFVDQRVDAFADHVLRDAGFHHLEPGPVHFQDDPVPVQHL